MKDPVTVTFKIADYAAAKGWEDTKKYNTVIIDENITATAAEGKQYTGSYYTNGTTWRIYQTDGGTLTFTAAEGKTIKTIKITYSQNNGGTLTNGGTNVASNDVVTVNASSITFGTASTTGKTNGQVRITEITVVYE